MGSCLSELIRVIEELHLDRYDEVQMVYGMARTGRLSESQARATLVGMQDLIDQQLRSPNLLARPPDEDQLYADGRPEVEIGTIENGLRFGLRISDPPRHVLSVGATRSGKTTGIRKLIQQIDRWNRDRERPVSIMVMDPKGGDYADLPGLGKHWRHCGQRLRMEAACLVCGACGYSKCG